MSKVEKEILTLVIACGGNTEKVRSIIERSTLTDDEKREAIEVVEDIEYES